MAWEMTWDGSMVWMPDETGVSYGSPTGGATQAAPDSTALASPTVSPTTASPFANYYNQLSPGLGFQDIWAAAGHGVDNPTSYGFNNFDYLNQNYGGDLFNLDPTSLTNDYLNFIVRADLPQIGNQGAIYGSTADQMLQYFQSIPGALEDPQVINYLTALDAANQSAGMHNQTWQQHQARRGQTTSALGICGAGESCSSCSPDCGVCPACPDGSCNGYETCMSCPID